MKTSEHNIKPIQSGLIHVPRPRRRQIQLDRTKYAKTAASPSHILANRCDLVSLFRELVFVDAASNLESFGMVSDRNIGITAQSRCLCHVLDRRGTVAPKGVHLQIAPNLMEALRILRSQYPGFRNCQEVLSNLRNGFFRVRRMLKPVQDLPFEIRTNTCELCKALSATDHVLCLFRPKKGTACGASEGPLQRLLCMFGRPGQEFGDVRISHVVLDIKPRPGSGFLGIRVLQSQA